MANVIALCGGFKQLKSGQKLRLKPNVATAVTGFMSPYGTMTKTKMLEGVVHFRL